VAELQKTNTPHVAVDISEENIRKLKELHPGTLQEMLYVVGDATEEDILEKAGLSRAAGLIAGLPLDKDNLVVTVIVRQRFPKMRIVARSAERKFAERMLRAGANSTVSPSQIGGLRMASELIRPHVVGFLDTMLKEQGRTVRVDEIEVNAASPWKGSTLRDLNLKGRYNLLVLGLKRPRAEGTLDLQVNPPDHSVVENQHIIIAMGDVKDIQHARQDAGA
jgi:voltage-gated potassium channel